MGVAKPGDRTSHDQRPTPGPIPGNATYRHPWPRIPRFEMASRPEPGSRAPHGALRSFETGGFPGHRVANPRGSSPELPRKWRSPASRSLNPSIGSRIEARISRSAATRSLETSDLRLNRAPKPAIGRRTEPRGATKPAVFRAAELPTPQVCRRNWPQCWRSAASRSLEPSICDGIKARCGRSIAERTLIELPNRQFTVASRPEAGRRPPHCTAIPAIRLGVEARSRHSAASRCLGTGGFPGRRASNPAGLPPELARSRRFGVATPRRNTPNGGTVYLVGPQTQSVQHNIYYRTSHGPQCTRLNRQGVFPGSRIILNRAAGSIHSVRSQHQATRSIHSLS